MTQAELAERVGVSRKTINTVENGVFIPSTLLALKLAQALKTKVEALFFLEPHRALVAGDLLVGVDGGVELPVSWFPKGEQEWADQQLKPELRERLGALPVELVLVSHGEPVLENGADALRRGLA